MILLISVCISVIYSTLVLPKIIRFICSSGAKKANFRGAYICTSAGISFVMFIITECVFLIIYGNTLDNTLPLIVDILSVLVGVLSAALTGYLDDVAGDDKKGIKDHGTMLLKMQYTSGGIKALVGIMIAFIISLSWKHSLIDVIVNGFIICLMQNFINLMDLRPGRAVKAYFVLIVTSLLASAARPVYYWAGISLLVMLFFYLFYELDEICMMGDTGSNTLGIMIGMVVASSENTTYKYIILIFLISAQVYSEIWSINSLFERLSILRFVDMIGRRK